MIDFKLTENFSFYEMVRTNHKAFQEKNRRVGLNYVPDLTGLCRCLLQPIRNYFNRPVIIISGFRCPELNELVKGSPNSQHCRGEAADFIIPGVEIDDILLWIRKESGLQFGQLIDENKESRWIHISRGEKNEYLIFKDGVYKRE